MPLGPALPMSEATLQTLDVNGIRMRVATQGAGPLVLLCHGFPESWHFWRHQMKALADAGWRAAAPDMRGYGGTDAPADPQSYTMLHHVADMVDLVKSLGERKAVIVGHDWGAPVAWHAALLRPDIFRAVAGMSVPYSPPIWCGLADDTGASRHKHVLHAVFPNPGRCGSRTPSGRRGNNPARHLQHVR